MEIPKFKLDLGEKSQALRETLLNVPEKYKYIFMKKMDNSKERLIKSSVLDTKRSIAVSELDNYIKNVGNNIQEELGQIISKQIDETSNYFSDCVTNYEILEVDDIRSKMYVAKNNIKSLTKDNLSEIDRIMEIDLEDTLTQINLDAGLGLSPQDSEKLREYFLEDLKKGVEETKAEILKLRDEITSLYQTTENVLVQNKLANPEKENSDLAQVSSSDNELMSEITPEAELSQKSVTEADLGNTFLDISVVERYMNVFAPNMHLGIENGYVVAKDESGTPYSVQKKEDVISFKSLSDDKRYGLKINSENQSISVKTYGEENLVNFETSTNTITLAYTADGGRKDYEFHFENGDIIAFELNGEEKTPVENVDLLVNQIESSGVRINQVLQVSRDLSIEGEQRS